MGTENMDIRDKAQLTPREKLRVAYFYEIRGVPQHVLADVFEVNPDRIAEAIATVRQAVGENESIQ